MTDYTKVYDPKGEMFEIPHERAQQLVLNEDWSWTPKEKVVAPAPAPEIVEEAPADVKDAASPKKGVRLN